MTRQMHDTRIGTLAVERGALTREEAERIATARTGPVHERIGERLLRARAVSLDLLQELLEEQTHRRGARPAPPAATLQLPRGGLLDCLGLLRSRLATELVVQPGQPRALRIHGALRPVDERPLGAAEVEALAIEAFSLEEVRSVEDGSPRERVIETDAGRFRAVLSPFEGGPSLTVRALNLEIGEHADRLPPEVSALAEVRRGLVVVAGAQGALRSSVLGQLVDLVNGTPRHVITMERRVSFQHASRAALIAQREVGRDTASFAAALRAALREDPDVLVVGDLWEPEAIATALLAAETGHLVICAIHAATPVQAIRRLVDVQGDRQRALVRASLANTLQAAVVVDVVPGKDGERFVVADVVPGSAAVVRLIREDRIHQLETITDGASGATSRDERILRLYGAGRLSRAVAIEHLRDPARIDGVAGPE